MSKSEGLQTIYGIADPRDFHTFYVGRSIHPKKRLYQHSKAQTPVGVYIRELQAYGYDPMLAIFETDLHSLVAQRQEYMWIRRKAAEGGIFFNYQGLPYKQRFPFYQASEAGHWAYLGIAARELGTSAAKLSSMITLGKIQARCTRRDDRCVLVNLDELHQIFDNPIQRVS